MTARDLIKELLEGDLDKKITIEYPVKVQEQNNYYRYDYAEQFIIREYEHGIIIGVEDV